MFIGLLSKRLQWAMDRKAGKVGRRITAADLAQATGVSRTAVSFWRNDKNGIDGEYARKAAAFLEVDPVWLETGQGNPIPKLEAAAASNLEANGGPKIIRAASELPVTGHVQSGPDGVLLIDDCTDGQGTVPYWSTCPEAYALRVRGESLSPRYLLGEFLAVDPCADVNPSNEAIITMSGGQRMFKRLLWQANSQVCLEAINKNAPNVTLEVHCVKRMDRVLGGVPAEAFRPN